MNQTNVQVIIQELEITVISVMINKVFVIHLSFFIVASLGASNCPNDICDAVYDNSLAVLRADDGDIIYPAEGKTCSSYKAVCMGDGCHACKCPLNEDTFDNHKEKCEDFDKKAKIVYSRGGLTVNTTVSTVYFAKNADSMYELRSVATDTQLPLVAPNGSSIDWIVNCTFNWMKVSTMHDNWEKISFDGYSLSEQNGKGFITVNPSSIKVQPEHLQGQLVEIKFKCPSAKFMYFKIQGRSVNLDTCLDCNGNFGYLSHLAIPDFPRPTGTSDSPINLGANVLQYKGNDISDCDPDTSEDPYASYYNPTTCSSLEVPGDGILYASGTSIRGRNFVNQNAAHWDTITGSVIKMYVTCSNNKDFCVLFRLANSSSICSGNPCMNGGKWVQNGLSSCVCQCPDGFSGEDCSIGTSCDDSPCCDGATCTDNSNSYTCSCPVGKTGSTCCDTDYCASNPCSEGATCTNDYDALSYSCACPPGKTGQTCNDFINYCADNPCFEEATCTSDHNSLSYVCSCPPGRTGQTCNTVINYCADNPCFEEATCTNDYDLLSYVCSCPPGRTGQTCSDFIDYCASNPCSEGATCTNNHQALSFQCSCPAGKTGQTCNEDIDNCANRPCAEGATCASVRDGFVCSCPPGKTGQTCDDDIDYCSSSPCFGVATCSNDREGRTFQCSCPSDRTGRTCETILPPISLELDSNQADGLESQDDSNKGLPYLYVVYAVLGVAFIIVVASVLAGVLYKKVYVPYKMRRSVRRATPFDASNTDETKHYNPMYLGSDTFEGDGNGQTVEDSHYDKPLLPAHVSFSNPMYGDVEDNLELTAAEEEESHPYELIDHKTDGDTMPYDSDGIYEEPENFQNITDGANKTTVIKNIYSTLERSNGSLVLERKGSAGSPFEEPDFFSGVGIPKIPSIYDTLKDDK